MGQLGVAKEKAIPEVAVIYRRQLVGGLGWEQSQAVMHTGVTHFLHGQSSHWDLRKADGCVEGTLIGHHEPHHGGRQQAGPQAAVSRRLNHNAYFRPYDPLSQPKDVCSRVKGSSLKGPPFASQVTELRGQVSSPPWTSVFTTTECS